MHSYEPDDDFDYRGDKLCQPKPAYVYVVRSLSAGAERVWEDLRKLTSISLNACVEELDLHSLFVCRQLLLSNTGGFKCLI
jgi:hypothetical protein